MATDARIGQEIGGYRVEALIGRGGMGSVYLAEQAFPRRKVALKLLSPELFEDKSFRDRFVRESEAAAAIDHPNIIPVYGAGEAEGCLYLAMRYVEGSDLGALLRRTGALPPQQALSIISQAASALDAAHSRGLIHRDVKPGNILIASGGADGSGHVYLSDFGLAKLATASIALTRPGDFVGTMHYAAPEQIEGKPLDERTDVYALGCVLYECLTGAPPFEKDSEPAIMYAHLLEQPPTATSRRPELPPGIDAVVRKSMAKSRDDRYSTAGALAEAARGGLRTAPELPRDVPAVTVPTEAGEAAAATIAQSQPTAPPTTPAPPAETPSAVPTTLGQPGEAPSGAPPTTPAYAGPPSPPTTQPEYPAGPPSPPPGPPEWGGPPSPPPGGPPAGPAKSRRNLVIAVVGGLVVLAAVGGILAFTLLGGDDGNGGGEGDRAAQTTEATTETEPAGVEVPDVVGESEDDAVDALEDEGFEVDVTTTQSEEEEGTVVDQDPRGGDDAEEGDEVALEVSGGLDPREALLALIPSRIRATCEDPDDPTAFPEAAVSKLVCQPPNRQAHSVQYNMFETRNEMVQAYNASLDQVRDDVGRNFRGGDCASDRFAEHTWNFQGSNGRVMCYLLEGNAWIEWSDNNLLVYTYALRNDDNDLTLYRWWNNRAFSGPRAAE